ncbi:MAG: helix-turn-helix transcriptional regulator, partial [Gammaproteobacteria bacterium]
MATRRERLAQRRKAVGFTQEGLAERLEIDRSTVVRWESGDSEPQPWLRPKIARALQVSVEQLAELLIEAAPGSAVAAVEPPDSSTLGHGGVLLPVIVNGRPVLLPLDAATVAASGLSSYLGELQAAGYSSSNAATTAEWEAMSPLNRRSLLTHGIAAAALPALGLDELQRVAAAMDDARRYLD